MTDNKCDDKSITTLKYNPDDGIENTFKLWSTPVVLCKPFSDDFLEELKRDVSKLLPQANKNMIDVWNLPDLPETMIKVRDKKIEISNRIFNEESEMPLPPLRIAKGYFRHIKYGEYIINPHHHGSTLGAGIFYIKLNDRNPGNLVILDPRGGVNYNNQFSPFKRIKLEEGLMVITPGYLVHFVEPTDYQRPIYEERIMIVSNIHRMYEDWIKVLEDKETDAMLTRMSSKPL